MPVSFTKAVLDYFGRKPDQSAGDFAAELRALDDKDRAYFRAEFAKIGIEVEAKLG